MKLSRESMEMLLTPCVSGNRRIHIASGSSDGVKIYTDREWVLGLYRPDHTQLIGITSAVIGSQWRSVKAGNS